MNDTTNDGKSTSCPDWDRVRIRITRLEHAYRSLADLQAMVLRYGDPELYALSQQFRFAGATRELKSFWLQVIADNEW